MTAYMDRLLQLIRSNNEIMEDLALLRSLQLPDVHVAAGYVRNCVWDRLHGYEERTPLNDIDVIYYDLEEMSEQFEKIIERQLNEQTGRSIWSVKNQARMHIRNRTKIGKRFGPGWKFYRRRCCGESGYFRHGRCHYRFA
ncbi:nucleotidyltransferase family protein [Paenibacillus piri]|uniref:nucleotidyltransferase family protein n=1 Tax=Paenibacillus piri TaxID=2547395 RepID=UPI001FE68162|nr:nucleotidyltransferase family protein [Paenibacillus piri]